MSFSRSSTRLALQIGLVILLFAASLAALLFNAVSTLALPERELAVRAELTEASAALAAAAQRAISESGGAEGNRGADVPLTQVTADVLTSYAGAEGGFYLADDDTFRGYAFPSEATALPAPSQRNDPPPLEAPYIREQARQSRSLPAGEVVSSVRDVGPSRVLVVTRPVGHRRPARLVAWTMVRLTGPVQMAEQIGRYRLSIALALAGMALAVVLTVRLAAIVERQRRQAQRMTDDLRRSEHLAALGKLLAGVAHEIRNPLAGIRSTIELWQRLGEAAFDPASMQAVIQAVDRLGGIVSRLLLFARHDTAERRPIALHSLLGETVSLCQASARQRGVALRLHLAAGEPWVLASPGALHQVLLNLLTNALDVSHEGGTIDVAERLDPAADRVEIRIADDGPGVAAADRPHLFEPFFTTRPGGTGLGLAICREIVVQQGGEIVLEEPSGPGATFRLTLPLRHADSERIPPSLVENQAH
ncbi:MAG TPA: ATP-binding protein [Pirellulales bacterium]|nr:ATP-binding protein [Pirellulales bacterium]